jgi:hypothetical protein
MPSNRPLDPARIRTQIASWPQAWANDDADVAVGQRIVAELTPFIDYLLTSDLSPSTQRRHIDNLGWLGRTLIDGRQYDDPPEPVPPLSEVVEDEGGPLLHRASEAEQRSFDTTCKTLHRFFTQADQNRPTVTPRRRRRTKVDPLDALIEDAILDTYTEDEQIRGFLVCLKDHVQTPFTTSVLGTQVEVLDFEIGARGGLVAVCQRGKTRQRIPLEDLPLPKPAVTDHAWILAYCRWLGKGN